jgi:hypothetical protein
MTSTSAAQPPAPIGVPVVAAAHYYLKWVNVSQTWVFITLPDDFGFHGEPSGRSSHWASAE